MDWKKFGKALLFPPIAVMILLVPISAAAVVYALLFLDSAAPLAIVAYVAAAYTLTVWCFKIPYLIRFCKTFKNENKYARRLSDDAHLRVNLSLYGSLLWNAAYGAFHVWLGYLHTSYWFYSLACYYIFLAVMRFFLLRHTRAYKPGEDMLRELKESRLCGWLLLAMNLALTLMIFFMVYWNRTFEHGEITTIIMAAYTFTALTVAIVNTVRYGKYKSPVFSTAKAISLASACVSMLTLESTMLTTFNNGTMDLTTRRLMLGLSGGVIAAFIIAMAIYMIRKSTRHFNRIRNEEMTHG